MVILEKYPNIDLVSECKITSYIVSGTMVIPSKESTNLTGCVEIIYVPNVNL